MIHMRRMITRLKYSWSVLKLACAVVFATNVYLLLRLLSRENIVDFTESQKGAAAVRRLAHHPLAHLLPSQDSFREVMKCTRPKLSLQHDALLFAFEHMPPLSCSGSNFFYLHNGYLIPNKTSKFSRPLKMCEIYAVKRESDFNAYLEKLVETNGSSSVKINEDFIYVRCRFYGDSGELRTRIEGEDKDKNDSQLDLIPVKEKIIFDSQLETSEKDKVKLLSTSQAQDNLMHDSQLSTKHDILTAQHYTHLSAIQDSTDKMVYDAWSDTRQDKVKITHYSQMDTKQADKVKLTHENQLGPGQEDKAKNYDQLDTRQKDKLKSSHDTQLDIKPDKISYDTHLGMKQDKLPHNTQLNMKQDKIAHNRKFSLKLDKIYDTQLNMKQNRISYDTHHEPKKDKVKVKRDTSRTEVKNSSNSHLYNEGVFLKTQSSNFNRTRFNVTHQNFIGSEQKTKDITITKIHSKDNQTRPNQGSEEIIKHENSTSDDIESVRYLNRNKSVGQTETALLLDQLVNSSERFRLSSQIKHRGLSNILAKQTGLEMEQGHFSSTNPKHIAVNKTEERDIHADDSLPDLEVEKYGDVDGGNSELEDSADQQGLNEKFRNFIRGRDDIYDEWDAAKLEMYMKIPACDEEQYLVQVSPLKHVFDRSRNNEAASTSNFNVLMFGIDSMSNLAFQRKLPESLNFLKKELDAVMFEGYNIVGDGTTQALLPMFLGQLQHEIPDILERHLDDLDFVWKRYRQRGYVTLFAEDEPHLGVFNLRLRGFEELPTDHYMRYFWQSQAQSHLKGDCSAKYCTGPTPNHHYLFQYLTDFFYKYPKIPHFAVGYSGELSHDEVNPSQYLDADLLKFLTHFKAEGHLNNTVLILFADHGSRKGNLRRTLQGKLEERLPFMSMVFPKSFKRKHRVLYENLKRNARGLTTPFDIHKTLLDILDMSKVYLASQQKAERGVSLFRSIPENRTCSQAGVDTHWCTCVQEIPIPTSDPVAKAAAEAVVATINKLTQANRQQCALLKLSSIHSASLVLPNLQVLTFHQSAEDGNFSARFGNATVDMADFQITLETDKCRGVFEATVHVQFHQDDNESSVENQGHARLTYSAFEHSISRIDTYGSQSACICKSSPNIMKFCCCERYLLGEQLGSC